MVIELGSRHIRAGFAGDARPKAVIYFGPEEQRRAGDYRKWSLGYEQNWRERVRDKDYGQAHELWRPDLRDMDLGLVSDKIERAIREAFTKSAQDHDIPSIADIVPDIFSLTQEHEE